MAFHLFDRYEKNCTLRQLYYLQDTGDVYTWGSNEFGQLGCPSINLERSRRSNDPLFISDTCVNVRALPEPVDIPEDRIISAVC